MPTTVSGLDPIIAKLEGLDDPSVFRRPMNQSVLHLHNKVAAYPSGNQHRPQPFKTDKSRRYFFAALKRGEIEVPYRRGQSPMSETLGKKWTRRINQSDLSFIIGNNVSYGLYVQDRDNQAHIHKKIGWITIQDVVEQEEETVVRFVKAEVDKILAK